MVMKAATIRVIMARGFFQLRKKVVRMMVIHSSRPRIVSGCRRTVRLERRRPSELYPLGI